MSLFDKIRVPLEDLTEEEKRAMDNDPEFQENLKRNIEELGSGRKRTEGKTKAASKGIVQ